MSGSCSTCGAELVRREKEAPSLFARRRTCGNDCKPQVWRQFDLRVMQVIYPYFSGTMVAKGLGRTDASVMNKAIEMGLRKTARGRSNAAVYQHIVKRSRRTA